MRFRLLVFCSCWMSVLAAQPDSALLLTPERLSAPDIITRGPELRKRQIFSATRSLEDVDQLPFTVWVVTAEDILRNGFVTLGDVLRAAPGIRVSQPGNALEGETFMIRGLPGNSQMKILINDVPVRPTVAPGMPIGAQLPIRQAERIEIFYGPASAIYGDGAAAGVINIVLKETERPIFTQADLAFGNFGYNSLDLMLGGKLFKDKKIFRFSLYGSSTVRERTDIYYDENLYKPGNYLPLGLDDSLYLLPNFKASAFNDSLARTAPIPHESRLLGINLTWRGIQFTYNRLARYDHSALGLSPLAVSYANPSNRIAERIETAAFRFQTRRRQRASSHTLSVIRYKLDNTSSFTPVFDRLSTALYYIKLPDINSGQQRRMALKDIYDRYAANDRYLVANSLDIRLESRMSAALRPNLMFTAGAFVNFGGGIPPSGYFVTPPEADIFGPTKQDTLIKQPFELNSDGNIEANTYGQLHWRGEKTTIIGGMALNLTLPYGLALAPRLAAQYRFDSTWTVFANYSEGFRNPSVYERNNVYQLTAQQHATATIWADRLNATERVRSAEVGIRRYSEWFTSELIAFYQEADHLTRNGYLVQEDTSWQFGYNQAPGRALSIWGIQGRLGDDILNFDLDRSHERPGDQSVSGRFEFYFQYSRGQESFGWGLPNTSDVRSFPRWMTQFRFSLRARTWEFMMSSNRQNAILSSAVVYRDFYQRKETLTHYPAYRTWDFMLRIYLSKQFLLYMHVQNAFNRHFAGIDASGTTDDLLYNPQQGRLLRFGLNYNMN